MAVLLLPVVLLLSVPNPVAVFEFPVVFKNNALTPNGPCECEFHPPFWSDSDARDEGFCFVPACDDEAKGYHRHYPTPIGSIDECCCLFPSRTACECEEGCEKFMCDRCGSKIEDGVLTK